MLENDFELKNKKRSNFWIKVLRSKDWGIIKETKRRDAQQKKDDKMFAVLVVKGCSMSLKNFPW